MQGPDIIALVNPGSGHGRAGRKWKAERSKFQALPQGGNIKEVIMGPGFPGWRSQIQGLATRGAASGRRGTLILVYGGDGTVHACLQALLRDGPDAGTITPILAIRGGGTGNDLMRNFQYLRSPEEVLQAWQEENVTATDIGILRGQHLTKAEAGGTADHEGIYFLNSVCFGLGGEVSRHMSSVIRLAWLRRNYLTGIVVSLCGYRPEKYAVTIQGKLFAENSHFASIAILNGKYFGGGIRIAPEARLQDGHLNMKTTRMPPRWRLPWEFCRLLTGRLAEGRLHASQTFKQAELNPAGGRQVPIDIDGECYFLQGRCEITAHPRRLRILGNLKAEGQP